ELVLVDPALARAERDRLLESARLALLVAEARVAATATASTLPGRRWREAVVPAVALVSLVANIVLAALLVSRRIDRAPTPAAVPVRTSSVDAGATTTKTIRTAPRPFPAGRAATSAAERHVFAWLERTPPAALPK